MAAATEMKPIVGVSPVWHRALLPALIVIGVLQASLALAVRPSITPDPAVGFLVHRSMQNGAAWNHLVSPREDDLASDHSTFIAGWSPGQYAVPGVLIGLGWSIGDAVTAVGIVSSLAGLAAWARFYRLLGFPQHIALLSCLLIALTRAFGLGFFLYPGSDLLAFAAFPALAALIVLTLSRPVSVVLIPFIVLVGFGLRNTLALSLAAWWGTGVAGDLIANRLRKGSWLLWSVTALLIAGAIVVIQIGYLSRGWTLMTSDEGWAFRTAALTPFAMPFLTATSIDDVLSRVLIYPDDPVFNYRASPWIAGAVLVAGGAFTARAIRRAGGAAIALQCFLFVFAIASLYALFVFSGFPMDLAPTRHYVLAGAVLLPFIVRWALELRGTVVRTGVLVMLVVPCVYGQAAVASNWYRHFGKRTSSSEAVQIAHLQLTPRLVKTFGILDREMPGANSLIVVPLPSYALEFSRRRVLGLNVTSAEPAAIARTRRSGVIDNLVVMTESRGMSGEAVDALLGTFVDYDRSNWEMVEIDGHRFHVPGSQIVNRAWLTRHFGAIGDE